MERFVGPDAGATQPSTAHPGEPHEFDVHCKRCGEPGMVHLSLITPSEVVRVEDRAAAPRLNDAAPLLAAAEAVCEAFPWTEPVTPRARALEDLRAAVDSARQDAS